MKPGSEDFGKNGEEYLSDGIIHTKMERVDDANIQRRIRCVKLRGTNHSTNYYTLIFQSGILQATRIIAEWALIRAESQFRIWAKNLMDARPHPATPRHQARRPRIRRWQGPTGT